jgi:hypothetical protein
MATMSSSEFICAYILVRYLESSETTNGSCAEPFRALCFLSEVAQPGKPSRFATYSELSTCFSDTVGTPEWLNGVADELSGFETVDTFSTVVERFRAVLQPNKSASFNGLRSPSLVTPDSSLGLFLRSVLARWDCLQFHQMCAMFSDVKVFVKGGRSGAAHETRDANSIFRFSHAQTEHHMYNVERGDANTIETELHLQYDCSGLEIVAGGAANSNTKNVAAALQAFLNSERNVRFASLKHQHALLQLGKMWQHNGNSEMAMAAIEEALKTAHHLGDHETVAHALLLLFETVRRSSDFTLAASAEDILLRCSQRCAALNLQALTARCTLLLAALRGRQRLQRNGLPLGADASSSRTVDALGALSSWKVEDVWSQVNFAALGEIALSAQVVSKKGITEDSEFTQTGSSANSMFQPQQNAASARKENLQDVPLNVGAEWARLTAECASHSADLWRHLQMPAMAEFTLRRALASAEVVAATRYEPVLLCTRLLHSNLEWALSGAVGDRTQMLQQVLQLGKEARRALHGRIEQDLETAQHLDAALLHTLYALAVEKRDMAKALRLAERVCHLTAPRFEHSCAAAEDEEEGNLPAWLTDEHFRARLLHCEATGRFCVPSALQLLADLRTRCGGPGDTVRREECDRLRLSLLRDGFLPSAAPQE